MNHQVFFCLCFQHPQWQAVTVQWDLYFSSGDQQKENDKWDKSSCRRALKFVRTQKNNKKWKFCIFHLFLCKWVRSCMQITLFPKETCNSQLVSSLSLMLQSEQCQFQVQDIMFIMLTNVVCIREWFNSFINSMHFGNTQPSFNVTLIVLCCPTHTVITLLVCCKSPETFSCVDPFVGLAMASCGVSALCARNNGNRNNSA